MTIPFSSTWILVPVSACRNSGFSNPKGAKSGLKNKFFKLASPYPLFLSSIAAFLRSVSSRSMASRFSPTKS